MSVVKLPPKPLPLMALRDVIVYPKLVMPLFVGRDKSMQAVDLSGNSDNKLILLTSQLDPENESLGREDLYHYGTLATILQKIVLPDSTYRLLVEGKQRVRLTDIIDDEGKSLIAHYEVLPQSMISDIDAISRVKVLHQAFEKLLKRGTSKLPSEVIELIRNELELAHLIDLLAMNLTIPFKTKQQLLEQVSVAERSVVLENALNWQDSKQDIDKSINRLTREQIEKNQREYYLNEQIKAIKKELNNDQEPTSEFDKIEEQIVEAKMPAEALEKVQSELKKLKMLSPMSAEASVTRTYIDWLIGLPWSKSAKLKKDLHRAKSILDSDHYGLDDVKKRILEFLAVQKRVKHQPATILCLVGPPGVGKTSLGESIASATGRKFIRIALGGVRDEAEIRGHRRTYIGSMPGKVIQKIARAKTNNPLVLLDEIDKLGADYRGDPAAALLEVLDPEQNKTFNDHYLDVDFDLSKTMFICTANSIAIPEALLDRMEMIRLPGYTELEKLQIAQRYLIPKALKTNGAKDRELAIKTSGLHSIINDYTRESGVRNLKREIDKLIRKVVTNNVLAAENNRASHKKVSKPKAINITTKNVASYLGIAKFRHLKAKADNVVGRVTGLAWTRAGGELLSIEVASLKGSGTVIKTGSLGDVMRESIQAAVTVVRSRAASLGIQADFYQKIDLHIHMPEGATPKDGPSAGIGMCTAMISELTQIAVKSSVAMTGEITLKGEVLAIGGLKEKLLAAQQRGIETVIIPKQNELQLQEIDDQIKDDLDIIAVEWIDEVLDIALEVKPMPLANLEAEHSEQPTNNLTAH